MIVINDAISIPLADVTLSFIRVGGPGGQNVNKVATAVQLRFDMMNCAALDGFVRDRLRIIAGTKVTKNGVIVLTANRFRTQEANRRDALHRLIEMIRQAAVRPKHRIARKPSLGTKRRRLDNKSKRGKLKRQRRSKPNADE